ncbi:hypothetical protein Q5752_000988 [Cryptotrichosporon argae]
MPSIPCLDTKTPSVYASHRKEHEALRACLTHRSRALTSGIHSYSWNDLMSSQTLQGSNTSSNYDILLLGRFIAVEAYSARQPLFHSVPPAAAAMTSRLQHDLTDAQLDLISLALFLALFPVAYMMYRHFRSLKERYPTVPPPRPVAVREASTRAEALAAARASAQRGAEDPAEGGVEKVKED